MLRRVPSIEKLEKLTGWRPRKSLDETIQKVIEYYQTQG
jgi:nucleoside-diphosphate-sugar epimerase